MRTSDIRREREARRRAGYRELILKAAERVILRKGYSALTMDDVARESGLSKATVYKYVAGKGPLLFEILGHSFDGLRGRIAEIADGAGSPGEKLRRLVQVVVDSHEDSRQLNRALFMDKAMLKLMRVFAPPLGRTGAGSQADRKMLGMIREKRRELIDLAARILDQGVAAGDFRRMATGQAAAFLEAVLQGYTLIRFWEGETPPAPDSAANLARFIVEGIRNPEPIRKEI
jgi:AcrR family transcriptional regulator